MIVDRTEWTDLRELVRAEIDADHAREAVRDRRRRVSAIAGSPAHPISPSPASREAA